jgi:hypothetical protein
MSPGDLMLRKKEIIATTATRGWFFITDQANSVINRMSDAAIDEENPEKSERLVSEARAARKFWKQLQQTLDASKQVEVEGAGDSDDWIDIATD